MPIGQAGPSCRRRAHVVDGRGAGNLGCTVGERREIRQNVRLCLGFVDGRKLVIQDNRRSEARVSRTVCRSDEPACAKTRSVQGDVGGPPTCAVPSSSCFCVAGNRGARESAFCLCESDTRTNLDRCVITTALYRLDKTAVYLYYSTKTKRSRRAAPRTANVSIFGR